MRTAPYVVSTRVTRVQLSAVKRLAQERGLSVSALVSSAVKSAIQLTNTNSTHDPEAYAKLEAVMKALGLSPSTKLPDVSQALIALIEAVGTGEGAADPVTGETADVPAQLARLTQQRAADRAKRAHARVARFEIDPSSGTVRTTRKTK